METFNTELTPLSYLHRSAAVLPDSPAVRYGTQTTSYAQLHAAAELRARAFRASGIKPGERIAYLMPNIPEMLLASFAVPLAEAVLVPINTRLAPEEIRYICDHSQAKILVVDSRLAHLVAPVAADLDTVEEIFIAHDPVLGPVDDAQLRVQYKARGIEELLDRAAADSAALPWTVDDEQDTISINYTSGTTGSPKGVMYSHRGAYLNAVSEIVHSGFTQDSGYLWTLPMFHCNGWCTGWALVAVGGTQVCLRDVRAEVIWQLIDDHGITHLNGAPTVLTTIMNAPEAHQLTTPITATVAAAPPSPTMIGRLEEAGFKIVHVYGLTETYGPYTVCQTQPGWAELPLTERARMLSRQGVGMVTADRVRVVAADTDGELEDVPADGHTIGEVVMRGNSVMKGYFRDPDATERAFHGGWFHSGDLGVMHENGYIELRDRAKDIVVSGGENISTIEVEQAILSHPAVLEVAVIGVPDSKWGERPKAFVVTHDDASVTEEELFEHLRAQLARYKNPRTIEFVQALPKTSTGKIQKFELRDKEWGDRSTRIQG